MAISIKGVQDGQVVTIQEKWELPSFDKISIEAFLVLVNSKRQIPWTMPRSIFLLKEQIGVESVEQLK